tara:strand:- start:122 stop:748 length:627 start_codon:yes stop_codon:yes gene_type:complete
MNYQEALTRHVHFEKHIKPCLKDVIEKQKKIIIDKNYYTTQSKYLLQFLEGGEYNEEHHRLLEMDYDFNELMMWLPLAPKECKETAINEVKDAIKRGELFIKRSKLMIFMATYIHNKDYEKAVKYSDKVKALSHEFIEDPDLCVVLDKDGTTSRGEGAYLFVCDREKKLWDSIENALKDLKFIVGPVKDVLKAGKKMNKRKNGKKNRG